MVENIVTVIKLPRLTFQKCQIHNPMSDDSLRKINTAVIDSLFQNEVFKVKNICIRFLIKPDQLNYS